MSRMGGINMTRLAAETRGSLSGPGQHGGETAPEAAGVLDHPTC